MENNFTHAERLQIHTKTFNNLHIQRNENVEKIQNASEWMPKLLKLTSVLSALFITSLLASHFSSNEKTKKTALMFAKTFGCMAVSTGVYGGYNQIRKMQLESENNKLSECLLFGYKTNDVLVQKARQKAETEVLIQRIRTNS